MLKGQEITVEKNASRAKNSNSCAFFADDCRVVRGHQECILHLGGQKYLFPREKVQTQFKMSLN